MLPSRIFPRAYRKWSREQYILAESVVSDVFDVLSAVLCCVFVWLKLVQKVTCVHTVVKASHTEVDYRAIPLKTIFQRNNLIMLLNVAIANPS